MVVVFILKGKVDTWWEDFNNIKCMRERELTWRKFEKYF